MTQDPALIFLENKLQELQLKMIERERQQVDTIITNLGKVIEALMEGLDTLNSSLTSMSTLVIEAANHKFDYHQRDMLETRIKEHTDRAASLIENCHALTTPIINMSLNKEP